MCFPVEFISPFPLLWLVLVCEEDDDGDDDDATFNLSTLETTGRHKQTNNSVRPIPSFHVSDPYIYPSFTYVHMYVICRVHPDALSILPVRDLVTKNNITDAMPPKYTKKKTESA